MLCKAIFVTQYLLPFIAQNQILSSVQREKHSCTRNRPDQKRKTERVPLPDASFLKTRTILQYYLQ